MEQQDLLQDLELEIFFQKASVGARFLNLSIDFACIILLVLIFEVIRDLFFLMGNSPQLDTVQLKDIRYYLLLQYLLGAAISVLFYTFIEGFSKGRTLGKLITGTRAVKLDYSAITIKDAFTRSLCRVVPFEIFSGFGTPWHDRWTDTQVVKVQK